MPIEPLPERTMTFDEIMEAYARDLKRLALAEEKLSLTQSWMRDACGWVLIESPEQ